MNKEERRIISLAALGGMLELYDFAIYGTFAIYFAHQFFPSSNPYTELMKIYMVFLLGFILRPVGGIIFSHLGDEFGRKKVLIYTILIMGISSLGISILPTYAQAGIKASILLLLLRLLQGLAIGGELPTTYVYISEAMSEKRFLAFGYTMSGVFCGYLFAALINYIMVKIFSKSELNDYAWRIPFALGGVVCIISYKIRKSLRETKAFREIMNKPKLPILLLLKNYKPQIIVGIILSAVQQVFSIIAILYLPSYLNAILHVDTAIISNLLPVGIITTILTIVYMGHYWQKKASNLYSTILASLIINALLMPVTFYLIYSRSSIFGGYISLMVIHGLLGLLVPLYITLLFPANIRLSGVALSYNISVATISAMAPIIITSTIKQTGLAYFAPVGYLMVLIILSLIAVLWMRKFFNKSCLV